MPDASSSLPAALEAQVAKLAKLLQMRRGALPLGWRDGLVVGVREER